MMTHKAGFWMAVLTAISMTLIESCNVSSAEVPPVKSARLHFDIKNSNANGKEIFINGQKAGIVPLVKDEKFHKASVEISGNCISAIATVNIINIENKALNIQDPAHKDLFAISNVFLEVTDRNGNLIRSDMAAGPFLSFKTGFIDLGNGKEEYTYLGTPLSEIRLVLSTEKLGYMKQPLFRNKTGEEYRSNSRRQWHGLDKIDVSEKKRTMCDCRSQDFSFHSSEYIMDMMDRYNSDILLICFSEEYLKNQKEKIKYLRQHGIKISLFYGCGRVRDPYKRLPESEDYKEFFKTIAEWAPLVDGMGVDEWFLSPATLKTEGGQETEITGKFIEAFAKYAGYSDEDAKWAFLNYASDDPRALKAWEFCARVQNDISKEFVRVAKKANPEIKTWISYITRNWNRNATCIDTAVNDFDEILQCQTYWYGRAAKDSLNSSLVTAPLGMRKIFKAEYPDKFLWCGIDPFYTGGKGNRDENSWGRKHYANTTEEAVPYLALLYATSDGVFIQNWEGKVLLGYKAKTKESEYLCHLGVKGEYVDRFAETVGLVSKIVPFIKSYKKSDIAYYYDPDADWKIIQKRVEKYFRQTNETSVGLIEEFCDVDVTKDVDKYKNVIYSGFLLPAKFDYARQNIYLMYAPEYDEKGNKIPENQLSDKLNVKGFETMGKNFFPANSTENGCSDQLQIAGLPKDTLGAGMIIKDALYPTRKASYSDAPGYFPIGARNKNGNVLLNSLWPSFTRQDAARAIIKKDLDYFGWTKRDCPQVNGTDKIVAVAFRDARTAVLDFGKDAAFTKVKLIMFNGREGVIRNETVKYERGMKIEIPPLNVLVAEGIK